MKDDDTKILEEAYTSISDVDEKIKCKECSARILPNKKRMNMCKSCFDSLKSEQRDESTQLDEGSGFGAWFQANRAEIQTIVKEHGKAGFTEALRYAFKGGIAKGYNDASGKAMRSNTLGTN